MPSVFLINGAIESVSDARFESLRESGLINEEGFEIRNHDEEDFVPNPFMIPRFAMRARMVERIMEGVPTTNMNGVPTNKTAKNIKTSTSYQVHRYMGYKPSMVGITNLVNELRELSSAKTLSERKMLSYFLGKLPYSSSNYCKNYGTTKKYLCKDSQLLFKLLENDKPLLEVYDEEYGYSVVRIDNM